jgi:hypothetical protein
MVTLLKPSFAGGELSPSLHARVDLAKYQSGLALARNFFVQAHGGASNRAGLRYVGEVKASATRGRLIPFQFNTTDTYVLEFGELVMRVIKAGAYVLEAGKTITGITQASPGVFTTSAAHGFSTGDEVYLSGIGGMTALNGRNAIVTVTGGSTFTLTGRDGVAISTASLPAFTSGGTVARIYQIATPYAAADLALLKFVQSADTMTIVHPSYQPRDLTRTGDAAWTLSTVSFVPGITQPTGVTVTPATAGAVTYRYKVTAVATTSGEESLSGLNTTVRTITGATQANPCQITSTAHGFATGDTVWISGVVGMTELNGREFTITSTGANTFTLNNTDATGFTAYSSGGTAARTFGITTAAATLSSTNYIDVSWTAVAGAASYIVYREKSGAYGFIGRTQGSTFRDDNISPDMTDGPPDFALPFFGAGNYPGCVTYHEERKVYGRTNSKRQSLFLSQSGAYNNFSTSFPVDDADAIEVALVSRQVHEIRHLVSLGGLLVMTSGGEWVAKPGGQSDAITPTSLVVKPQSYRGGADVPPIVVGSMALYVQDRGQIVRDLGYKYDVDSYTGDDLTLLSRHLFEARTVREWAYAQAPWSVVWCVMSDGGLLSLTYLREHEVWAWSRHDTDGDFESVAVVSEGSEDVAYLLVRRVVGGVTRRYVERLASRQVYDVQDAFFVDAGLSLDVPVSIASITSANPPVVTTGAAHGLTTGDLVDIEGTLAFNPSFPASSDDRFVAHATAGQRYMVTVTGATTFTLRDYLTGAAVSGASWTALGRGGNVRRAVTTVSGLHHLNGKTVAILANGDVQPAQVVSGGTVTLDRAASRVHVGLPYVCDLQTLRLDVGGQPDGTMQGRKKVIPFVTIRMERSRGLAGGPRETHLKELKQGPDAYNTPTGLYTGDYKLSVPGDWATGGQLFLRQSYPLPATVLGLIPEVVFGAH